MHLNENHTDKTTEFTKLYLRYRDSFVVIARSYVRSQEVAEDIVSEAFTAWWDKREQIHIETSAEAYILRSVKNRCLNYLRDNMKLISANGNSDPESRLKSEAMLYEISVLESPDIADVFSTEIKQIFSDFMKNLPARTHDIFYSSRFEGLTHEEIAKKYGVSPRIVKRDIQKALDKLRKALKDYLPMLILWVCSMPWNSLWGGQ